MTIEDVMTRDVITVRPEALIHEAARLMATHGVSGLPVIDDGGQVMGIISDGDLILRQRPRKDKPWWRSFFANGERLAREYRKATGLTVGEVMTHPALVISPVFAIETAAAILETRGIRRLPVVRDGRLVGIVSRGDLIKALAASAPPILSRAPASPVAEVKSRERASGTGPVTSRSVQARSSLRSLRRRRSRGRPGS
jgi:CBS domain-containing protein